ncbi:hypothetical protein SK128_003266, partial [Halocaridina rubra]
MGAGYGRGCSCMGGRTTSRPASYLWRDLDVCRSSPVYSAIGPSTYDVFSRVE